MDEHFRTEPVERNLPAVLALLEIWYVNFFGAQTRVVVPYSEDLRDLPAYLQQLEMESNGKRVDRDGREVDYDTAPVVWGAAGTPSQHSFHQLLHQGTRLVPVDFIIAGREPSLAANALAQAAALAFGNPQPGAPYKALPGNRPSSTIVLKHLAPGALGELIAMYEHKVFVEGAIWNVNSFDQWGVEHGKTVARTLAPRLRDGGQAADLDSSTRGLLARLRGRD
jgi:glucose-6-phosphate isomerase